MAENWSLMAAIVIAALVIGGAMAYSAQNASGKTTIFNATQEEAQNLKTISVNGESKIFVAPDKVDLYFSIETTALNALDSQQENAAVEEAVKNAVKAAGVPDSEIQTVSYNVYPEYDYSSEGKTTLRDYKTTHQLKVELTDLSKAGKVIDAAVQAGANRVNSIEYGLTDAKQASVEREQLKLAAQDARAKAEKISEGIGTRVTGVKSVSESAYYTPYYRSYDMVGASSAPKAETTFTPSDIQVTATVSAVFLIE
ncbi:MAG: SIMPL domain-containing protein [Candidatus Diapherotrites archaeon]